jgi:carboxyl-terminal processing protease
MRQVQLKLTFLAIALVLLPTLAVFQGNRSSANLSDSPKAIIDEAWQLVQKEYVDRSFNGQDWQAVRQDYLDRDYSSQKAAYEAVNKMVNSLEDEYTRFLPPQALKDLVSNVSGEFIGVGVTVSLDPKTREWIVVEPFIDSPAATAGIQPQDIILSINSTPTSEINPSQAAPYLIGPVGSKLKLRVRRLDKEQDYELIREQINLNPLTFKVQNTPKGKLGYIRLPVFTSKSPAAMKTAIETLEGQGVQGYVLDLRGNPGGVLDAGIAIARMWIDQGRLMSLTTGDGKTEIYDGDRTGLTTKPVQVLVDKKSASASEVLAGAIQDNQRGILVGEQTFGKGVVQSLEKLGKEAGLVITVAQYFTPSGKNIHKKGIKPDQSISPSIAPPENANSLSVKTDQIFLKAQDNLLKILP